MAVEDLNVADMANRKRHLGRRLADAGLSEIRRQLTYKTADHGRQLVAVGRFYPSSKTCSSCGVVKAKLPLWERTFACKTCGASLDRDVNAARNIAREALRLLGTAPNHDSHQDQQDGAGLRPESENAAPRPHKTGQAQLNRQGRPRGEPSSHHPERWRHEHLDETLATASGTAHETRRNPPRITWFAEPRPLAGRSAR